MLSGRQPAVTLRYWFFPDLQIDSPNRTDKVTASIAASIDRARDESGILQEAAQLNPRLFPQRRDPRRLTYASDRYNHE
jgi:hypothetical protein